MKSKEIKKLTDEGYLRVNVIFEIAGKPKKHIEDTLKAYIENIKQDEQIQVITEEYEDAEELEEGVFSTVAEIEMLLPTIEKLNWLCINFSPASVEILEPEKKTVSQKEIGEWMNDLLSRLHEIGMVQKNLKGQYDILVRNFNAMTRNAIILSLKETNELDAIAKKIGMPKEHTEKFLEALIKEEKVKKDKNKYFLKD
jgi:hypothetical protein